jgi:hypothetical protein
MKTFKLCLIGLGVLGLAASDMTSQQITGPYRGSLPVSARRLNRAVPLQGFRITSVPMAAEPKKKLRREPESLHRQQLPTAAPAGTNFVLDSSTLAGRSDVPPIILESFAAIPRTGSYPPDPVIAAGPDHLVTVVNSEIRIFGKEGTLLETINASAWLDAVVPGCRPYDPRVLFDHFAGRFLMLWHHFSKTPDASYYFLSISESDDPTEGWVTWPLPGDVTGGTPSGTWADNGCLGLDSSAVYIVSNQYTFDTMEPADVRVRILPKRDLYSGKEEISWSDFSIAGAFCVRPTVVHGQSDQYFLLEAPNPLPTATAVLLYRIDDPVNDPALTVSQVSVVEFGRATDAVQAGSDFPLDTRRSYLHSEAQWMNGSLHAVHSVANPLSPGCSAIRYLCINTSAAAATADVTFGAPGYWYFYPAVAVDINGNAIVTFARSSPVEYAGAHFTWRLAGDGATLRPSTVVQRGWAAYREVDGYGANRWGDYSGAAVDPSDGHQFWLMGEHADGQNRWGTWVKSARLVPFEAPTLVTETRALDFGYVALGGVPGRVGVTLRNGGYQPLTVSSVATSSSAFAVAGLPPLPLALGMYDSVRIEVTFAPADTGVATDDVVITSNDQAAAQRMISLRGVGIQIQETVPSRIYAVQVDRSGTVLHFLNAQGEIEGSAALSDPGVRGLSVDLQHDQLYGVARADHGAMIMHVDGVRGQLYPARVVEVHGVAAISASHRDTFYCATDTGSVYRFIPSREELAPIGERHGVGFSGLVATGAGQLWAVAGSPPANDTLYSIDTQTGAIVPVGRTGFSVRTNSLCRAPDGGLLGLVENALVRIDSVTGGGTFQAYVALEGLCAIAAGPQVTGVARGDLSVLPLRFALEQNYPNPFNPSTIIRYQLPVACDVRLTVYDLLGREVRVLLQEKKRPGAYEARFDAPDLASGVYFYRLVAGGFVESRKSLLVR